MIEIVFSSSIKLMNIVLDTVEQFLKSMGIDTDKHWKVLLALREIVANGIIHGNRRDPSKKIKIKVEYKEKLRFEVKDEGEKFDFEGISRGAENNLLRERGRGLCLVKQIMDMVSYEFSGGNLIIMEKEI